MLVLAGHLAVDDFAVLAPQATNYSWYPYSFLAPPKHNEPWLSSAVNILNEIVADIHGAGIISHQIFFTGFSQGACLALEYVTRHARTWGGVAAFSGGLIGDRIYAENYAGDFGKTAIFIGSADPDPHIPVARVKETTRLLREMNASVTEKIYPGLGHTIGQDEIDLANRLIFQKNSKADSRR